MDALKPRSQKELRFIVGAWRSEHSKRARTFLRGQSNRYFRSNGKDWLCPAICRSDGGYVTHEELKRRLDTLKRTMFDMATTYLGSPSWTTPEDVRRMFSDEHVCQSLCQHYKLCKTTHLDVTEDLEIAYTFAKWKDVSKGFLFLIEAPDRCPHAVNVFFEQNLYVVDLQRISRKQAERPRLQKAWSLSFYPGISAITSELYAPDAFNLASHIDVVIDLSLITEKPRYAYEGLMVEDEFFRSVRGCTRRRRGCSGE